MLEGLLIFVSGLFLGIILTVAIFFILRKQFENVRTPSDDAAFARFREEKEALEKKSQELEQEIQRFQKVMGNQASSPQERSPQFTEMREQIKEQEALIHSLKSTLQNVKGRLKSEPTVHESPDSDIQDRRSEDEEVIEETPPPQKVLAPSQAGASGESNRPPMMNTKPGEGSYSSARDARVRNKLESEKNDSSKKPARLRNLADPNAATVQTKKDSSPETKILMTSENSPKIKKDANPSQLTSEEVTDEALIESFMKTIPPSKPPSIKNDEKNKHHHRNRMLLNVDSSEKKSDVAERKPDVVLGVDSTGNSEEEEIDLAKLNPQQRRKYQDELAMKSVLGRGALGKNRTPSSKPTQKK